MGSFTLPPWRGKKRPPSAKHPAFMGVNPNPKKLPPAEDARRRQMPLRWTTAERWNQAYPIGTRVRYFPTLPSGGVPPVETVTCSEAWTLGDGSPVVKITGRAGGVHLAHLQVIR